MAAHRDDERRPDGPRPSEDLLLRSLYQTHASALLRFTLRLTNGDRQRAEDIVQETLLRAWRNAHKLGPSPTAALRPWLVTVARRIAIDEYRGTASRATEVYGHDLDTLVTGDDTDGVLSQLLITSALRGLSGPHREIVVQTYLRDRSVEEAARNLGIPVGTAKSRLHYALRALRTALTELGVTR